MMNEEELKTQNATSADSTEKNESGSTAIESRGDGALETIGSDDQPPPIVQIVTSPHWILKQRSTPVDITKDEERAHAIALAAVLSKTVVELNALGMAANQLGATRAVMVFKRLQPGEVVACVNPRITARGHAMGIWTEGCLSFPGVSARTRRPKSIVVHYLRLPDFEPVIEDLSGRDAVVFQHEWDHLQGKTMKDRTFMGRAP